MSVESRLKGLKYNTSLNPFQAAFVLPDFARTKLFFQFQWSTKILPFHLIIAFDLNS